MSESQSPDEAVSFNYKELDMIGKGMYRSILNVVCCMNDVKDTRRISKYTFHFISTPFYRVLAI